MRLLWISLGGALGTAARYALTAWSVRAFGTAFPYATVAINIVGSLLIGVLMHVPAEASPTVRLALTTGLMGGFTTASTFSFETVRYLQSGAYRTALLNVAITVVGCVLACAAGIALGKRLGAG